MSSFLRFSWRTMACLGLISAWVCAQETNAPVDSAPTPASAPAANLPGVPSANFLDNRSGSTPSNLSLTPPAPDATAPVMVDIANPVAEAEDLADHLLVVYNRNDFDSKALAEYYASRRNIPPERVFPISCSGNEEITRAEFENTIRQPILFYLLQKKWMTRQSSQLRLGNRVINLLTATHNDIWAIVLMRGVPLKIAPDPSDDDVMESEAFFKSNGLGMDPAIATLLQTNAAAVDSELALLPVFGLPKGGYVPNVFFDARGTGQHRVGSELAKNIVLVSRLDGPTPAMVRRMIDDSLYAEKNRLAGLAVIDSRGITDPKSPIYGGDAWLRTARNLLLRYGWVVEFDDKPDVLPPTEPCNQVALYLGWYSAQAEGPWVTPPYRFVPGAIAYHLHSFSASTVRSETSNWVGPLIAHGADATMGTVYEPLLGWTPHEDIFTRRILMGNYFVEAAYASQLGLSWMVTVVGDPLYRPFRQPLDTAIVNVGTPRTDHDDWLLVQQIRREIFSGQINVTGDQLREMLEVPGAGPVAEEYLGDLLMQDHEPQPDYLPDQAYKKAESSYTLSIDRIRVGIKLAKYYRNHDELPRAQAQIDMLRQLFPKDAPRFGITNSLVMAATPLESPVPPAPIVAKNAPIAAPAPVSPSSPPPAPPKAPMPPFPQPASGPQ